jgi:hypothetical protein
LKNQTAFIEAFQITQLQIRQLLNYFTSLCGVCLRQTRQNFFSSSRSVMVFRFLVVE